MKRAIKILFAFLLSMIQLPAVAQRALTLTSGEMSTNTVVAKPTKTIEQVSDGVIVTYTFSTVSETYPTEDFHEMLWNMPGFATYPQPGYPAIPFRNDIYTQDGLSIPLVHSSYTSSSR